jgi:hypothetical protein
LLIEAGDLVIEREITMSTGQPCGSNGQPRFHVVGNETSWRATLEGAKSIRDRLGTKLLAAFLKCFVGTDRLLALEHFLVLSLPMPQDHASHRRNVRATITLFSATLVELSEALQQLCNAKVVDALSDKSLWDPLNAKRKLWQNDKGLRLVRNGMGAHLGDIASFEKGIDALVEEDDDLVFTEGNGGRRHDAEHVLGWNAMFKGTGIEATDMEHIVELTRKGHSEYPEQLWMVWRNVLETAGVRLLMTE